MERPQPFISDRKAKQNKIISKSLDSELDFLHLAPESSVDLGKLHKIGI